MYRVANTRICRFIATISAFLIIVALIAGMAGCDRGEYVLSISSTVGGTVTSPGEGNLAYPSGATVILMAQADPGYRFVRWTGDVRSIKDAESASTMIAVRGNYSITANFEWAP
ncbi:MAG: hypothetical protein IBX67_00750 [Dehalococcoidia bacterium]|nr:hypothetical protein [Dehalococcoidia bacterium]